MTITETLFSKADPNNAAFMAKLAPTLSRDVFIGVKVPLIREIEKQFRNTEEAGAFISTLPHQYYEENLLHAYFISNMKDYAEVLEAIEVFLPYVDNWAVCDSLRPNVFKKKKEDLMTYVKSWISSPETYTCRFGVDMLMTYYLDADFKSEYLKLPAEVRSEEYYVNMMIAWYYATALAKHWPNTVVYLEKNRLPKWVHNKTIQKACESYRITAEQKKYLKTLKRK